MKKRAWLFLVFICVLLLLVGCTIEDKKRLEAPKNIIIDGTTLRFDRVENATQYILNINDETIILSENFYEGLVPNTDYKIALRAKSSSVLSLYSQEMNFKILPTPSTFTVLGENIYWSKVDGAVSYTLEIEGSKINVGDAVHFRYVYSTPGYKEIRIKSIGNGTTTFDSTYSETAFAYLTGSDWNYIKSLKPSGNGNRIVPYLIENIGNYKWIVDESQKGNSFEYNYFKLTADIDFKYIQNILPIGTATAPFNGNFDGGNKGIYNFNIEADEAGIFSYLGESGQVTNLSKIGGSVVGIYAAGGIVAKNSGTVINCSNGGTVTANVAGGIVGETGFNSVVTNVKNNSKVSGSISGGIVGYNLGAEISSAINNGDVYGLEVGGGVVGFNEGQVLFGRNFNEVVASSGGGIVGENRGTIQKSFNYGVVNATRFGGGIAGNNNGKILFSYNAGNIVGSGATLDKAYGGIVGKLSDGMIINCYTMHNYIPSARSGGIAGYYRSGLIENAYYGDASKSAVGNTDKFIGNAITVSNQVMQTEEFASLLNELVAKEDLTAAYGSMWTYSNTLGHTTLWYNR